VEEVEYADLEHDNKDESEYTNVMRSKSEPIPNDNDGNKSVSDDDSDDSTDGTVDALAQN
jgi:hypothetical protein